MRIDKPKRTLSDLCLECGLCCDGSLFADVRLQPGDDAARLSKLGVALTPNASLKKQGFENLPAFPQPCSMLEGCRCRVYADRPQHCRHFECALLKKLQGGDISFTSAQKEVRLARRRVTKVLELLRALGDTDEHKPVAARVRQTGSRLANVGLNPETRRTYGELTLAAHDMNFLLGDCFYPGWH